MCDNCLFNGICSDNRKSRAECSDKQEYDPFGFYPGGTPRRVICDICKYKGWLCINDYTWDKYSLESKKALMDNYKNYQVVNCYGLEDSMDHCDHFEEKPN